MSGNRVSARALLRSGFFVAALLVVSASGLFAQAGITTGTIRGVITDREGQAVADADVTVRNVATGLTRTVGTNTEGYFAIPGLQVGNYDLQATAAFGQVGREGLVVRLGEALDLTLALEPIEVEAIVAIGVADVIDTTDATFSQRFSEEVVEALPNNGRNFLDYTLLTPGTAIVQGPDADELTIAGARGIFNNITIDGADYNNPFFGEQRGGTRPAFVFNIDAVEEMVVIAQGANAEYGRSAGGFINVLTKSGTNEVTASAHLFGQGSGLSADLARGGGNPQFDQQQYGFTLGGPIAKDKAFFFIAFDQQQFNQTKQDPRVNVNDTAEFAKLNAFLQTAFGGVLADDFGPIDRTDDNTAFFAKFDFNLASSSNLSIKYNYTKNEQVNGTFDVDTWARSANGLETSETNALNFNLYSQVNDATTNEFRFQWAIEDRLRPYEGPTNPASGRPFPDTAMTFADGFRIGLPFFLPIDNARDDRIQIANNLSLFKGNHLYKVGFEYNRTGIDQTFLGFADTRFIFDTVDGFINYVEQGNGYVTCSDGSDSNDGTCPDGASITGPVVYFQQGAVPVPPVSSPVEAGTQAFKQNELAFFIQDTWTMNEATTLNYGLRWEGLWQPDMLTPADEVFYGPFIGQEKDGQTFPSDGTIPNDLNNFQPRVGLAYDAGGDGDKLLRANFGIYHARIPALVLAQHRTANGSRAQNIFRLSEFHSFGAPPPNYGETFPTTGVFPDHPDLQVPATNLVLPRYTSFSAEWQQLATETLAWYVNYQHNRGDNLFRFVNRNDAVFGSPWSTGLPALANNSQGDADTLNGISSAGFAGLVTAESTAKSRYNGLTFGLRGAINPKVQMEFNYTLSWDKTDDDNERDPFVYRYAKADELDAEWGYSDRDQRHRFNLWITTQLPYDIQWNNVVSAQSAQPISEVCGANNQGTGERAGAPGQRICPDGSILPRNTLRKENDFFTWNLRFSKMFWFGGGNGIEGIVDIFNLTNADNFRDPSAFDPAFNFDGTVQSGLGDPFRMQLGVRYVHR